MTARTLAVISDEIQEIQIDVKDLNKEIEALEKKKAFLEKELEEEAEKQGLKSGSGAASSFKIEAETVPQGSNWDETYEFIHENKYYHLLQKRFAVTAIRELWELGKDIPGVNKFTKNKVTVKGV